MKLPFICVLLYIIICSHNKKKTTPIPTARHTYVLAIFYTVNYIVLMKNFPRQLVYFSWGKKQKNRATTSNSGLQWHAKTWTITHGEWPRRFISKVVRATPEPFYMRNLQSIDIHVSDNTKCISSTNENRAICSIIPNEIVGSTNYQIIMRECDL